MEAGTVRKMTPAHQDERRAIYEFSLDPATKVFLISKGRLGNEYHKKKTEELLLASGHAILVIEKANKKERETQTMKEGDAVIIPPGIAHLFIFDGPAVLVATERPYDPNDSVSHFFEFFE